MAASAVAAIIEGLAVLKDEPERVLASSTTPTTFAMA